MLETVTTYIYLIIYVACVSYAMWTDATRMTIPNKVSIILTAAFGFFAIQHLQLVSAAVHIGIALAIFAVTFACFVMHWMGGGDVKLLSAVSAWMGPEYIMPFLFNVALFGGLLALTIIILRRAVQTSALSNRFPALCLRFGQASSRHVPYAIPIGCAALLSASVLFPELGTS